MGLGRGWEETSPEPPDVGRSSPNLEQPLRQVYVRYGVLPDVVVDNKALKAALEIMLQPVPLVLRINLHRLFAALACAALNLRNKQLSILVALSAAIALIAALLRTLNVLSYVKYMFGRI